MEILGNYLEEPYPLALVRYPDLDQIPPSYMYGFVSTLKEVAEFSILNVEIAGIAKLKGLHQSA